MKQNRSFLRNLLIKTFLGLLILSWSSQGFPQTESECLVSKKITKTIFTPYQLKAQKKRKIMILKGVNLSTKLNPFTYIAAGLMYTYQNVISEQISASCIYEISCSEMTKKSIEKHGLIRGTLFGLHQLANCSPSIKKDRSEYLISSDNLIINQVE